MVSEYLHPSSMQHEPETMFPAQMHFLIVLSKFPLLNTIRNCAWARNVISG